ncbi:MAG: L,D-transpeptidase family protein, partial [Deltaproteobacteria bacterium]
MNSSDFSISNRNVTLKIALIVLAFLCVAIHIPCESAVASNLSDRVREILEDKITSSPKAKDFTCRRELLCGPKVIILFYMNRDFRPAWSGNYGPLPKADDLLRIIHDVDHDGLRPGDYHLLNIRALLAQLEFNRDAGKPLNPNILADLDLLLTDSFFLCGSHLLTGRVNPETIQSEWAIKSRYEDLVRMLQRAIETNEIEGTLRKLRPQYPGYMGLRKALAQYSSIKKLGGWPEVPAGSKMELGDRGIRIKALQSRLSISGDIDISEERNLDVFDEALDRGVRRFQARHGLKVDGIVGPHTLRALNVPLEKRIDQLKANMERWRWLPESLGSRYIVVNIANFELEIIEDGQVFMKMPVVVGKRYRKTPVFTGKMTYVEVNPYWHIPWSIARKDILPKIRKDPKYLAKKHIKVFSSWKDGAREIAPESVDWSQITSKNLSFKFRQEPGPYNSLGRVKFMFPNKFNVYLHDTPAKQLFNKTRRIFSSGCIRVKKPIKLMTYLLRDNPNWSRKSILK